jgi:hypothetical protein
MRPHPLAALLPNQPHLDGGKLGMSPPFLPQDQLERPMKSLLAISEDEESPEMIFQDP